jgi:hypothetical protein
VHLAPSYPTAFWDFAGPIRCPNLNFILPYLLAVWFRDAAADWSCEIDWTIAGSAIISCYLYLMPPDEGVAAKAPHALPIRSRMRILLWLFPLASFCFAYLLGDAGAIYSPDASYYRALAIGQHEAVPSPFSARVLGPAIAGRLGRLSGLGVDKGFLFLGIVCLAVFLALVFQLVQHGAARGSGLADAALCSAIFLLPFWVDIFHDYYLPDLIHATILAALLLCLVAGRLSLAMLLLFPAFLARESTLLVSICLVWAARRRVPARAMAIGVIATVSGALASRHFDCLGPMGREGLHGGLYALGKVLWSLPRNTIGLALWTNTLPFCSSPKWVTTIPAWLSLGQIHQIGVCGLSPWGPARAFLAWLGIFGTGPGVAIAVRRALRSPGLLSQRRWLNAGEAKRRDCQGAAIAYRLSLLYGGVSFLLAPALGASVDRLVAYGWPFFFIALSWFLSAHLTAVRAHAAWILLLHIAASWIAWFGFRMQSTPGYGVAGVLALLLNAAAYFLVERSVDKVRSDAPVVDPELNFRMTS